MALPSGTRLGPYEILTPLGAGGMGEVYRIGWVNYQFDARLALAEIDLTSGDAARGRTDLQSSLETQTRRASRASHGRLAGSPAAEARGLP